jgi:hypothetical protein
MTDAEKTGENVEKKKEERRIIKISDRRYQLLKPRTDREGWHKYGENKSLEAISNLFKSGRFALTMEESLFYEIVAYQKEQEKKREKYLSEKGLESKTI